MSETGTTGVIQATAIWEVKPDGGQDEASCR